MRIQYNFTSINFALVGNERMKLCDLIKVGKTSDSKIELNIVLKPKELIFVQLVHLRAMTLV